MEVPDGYFGERIAALCNRWSGWNREPFTTDSSSHVSVWEKPTA